MSKTIFVPISELRHWVFDSQFYILRVTLHFCQRRFLSLIHSRAQTAEFDFLFVPLNKAATVEKVDLVKSGISYTNSDTRIGYYVK